jgi:nitrite reductase (NADH) small subunit
MTRMRIPPVTGITGHRQRFTVFVMKHRVAAVDEIPEGRSLLIELQGRSIAVFRINGYYFAVDDACPHKGGALHEGTVQDGVVSCPWHDWRFDLRTGKCPVNPLSRVETYPVWVERDDVFVEIEEA